MTSVKSYISLIENWFPIEEIGIESKRENSTGLHPPVNRLHVWWARRPLTASGAAILASLLPAYSDEWPAEMKKLFPSEKEYRNWFLRLIGIHGDPVAAKKLLNWAIATGKKIANPYGYPRAFTNNPDQSDLQSLNILLESTWGTKEIRTLDPTAGGGTIPFESLRYGFETFANELNPVASVILKATLEYPFSLGPEFAEQILKYGKKLSGAVREKLSRFFPGPSDGEIFTYLWARTVNCPGTGKPVPLSPNWWLQKKGDAVSAKLLAKPEWDQCRFQILQGQKAIDSNPDKGPIKKGVAISPWTGETIPGDYIKEEAQAGRMGQQLYVIRVKTRMAMSSDLHPKLILKP